MKIQLIVEGDGDLTAVPVLVRRILHSKNIFDVDIAQPVHRRGDIPKVRGRFRDFFEVAAIQGHPVLCVLDFDCDDCVDVETTENEFRALARELRPDYPFEACFIVKEFESIFLFDENCVRNVLPAVRPEYVFPLAPETIRDAKGELSTALPKGWSYKPTVHQAKLSANVNLELLLEASPSFQRLQTAVLNLIEL